MSNDMEPSMADVIAFVRDFAGCRREIIDENTWLEKDLGITGDDGVELLEEAEKVFGVSFSAEEGGFRKAFSLKENEYLFHSEGIDFLALFISADDCAVFLCLSSAISLSASCIACWLKRLTKKRELPDRRIAQDGA